MPHFYRFIHFEKYPALFHAITTKSDAYPYNFSLALHTRENKTDIIHNRQTLVKQLSLSPQTYFIVANQTHSANIAVISDEASKGWQGLENTIKNSDALITNIPNIVLTILTADCVPILLYDPKEKIVAAVHAGWKGTKSNIVGKTVMKMQKVFHSDPSNIIAGIAPAIGRCCYEVGEDVAKHFFNFEGAYTPQDNKYMLDLPFINKQQLLHSGIAEQNIELSHLCTSCHTDRFFSYRNENGCSGRFMSLIGLKKHL